MQLEGATELERRVYDTCLRVEHELPASTLATDIVVALSEAGQELQRLRALIEGDKHNDEYATRQSGDNSWQPGYVDRQ